MAGAECSGWGQRPAPPKDRHLEEPPGPVVCPPSHCPYPDRDCLGERVLQLRLLRAANEEIQRKAATLDPDARARFLTAVAVNRAVAEDLAAHQLEGQPTGPNDAAPD